jgi:hypothetical protein
MTESHSDYNGKIAMLDLVSGVQVCAEIIDLDDSTITVRKPMVFQVAVEPQDPSQPPHQTMNPIVQKVNAAPYGGPFVVAKTEMKFDLIHIIQMHEAMTQFEKGYLQATTGIEIAGAGALSALAR